MYSPLNEEDDEIRIIQILPRNSLSEPIRCEMRTVSLKACTPEYSQHKLATGPGLTSRRLTSTWSEKVKPSTPNFTAQGKALDRHVPMPERYRFKWGDFAAVSYTWDEPHQAKRDLVINGLVFEVTSKVEAILNSLSERSDFEQRYGIWIDALCINQKDLKERGNQVGKMRDIYGQAWSVIAWLGEETLWVERAFDLATKLSTYTEGDKGTKLNKALWKDPEFLGRDCWIPFYNVLQNSYWTRCWVSVHRYTSLHQMS